MQISVFCTCETKPVASIAIGSWSNMTVCGHPFGGEEELDGTLEGLKAAWSQKRKSWFVLIDVLYL